MPVENNPVIEYYSIYDIDVKEGTHDNIDLKLNSDHDLLKFLKKVASNTRTSTSKRQATFTLNSPVRVGLEKILINDDRSLHSQNIAQILFESEEKYAEKVERLNRELKKGSLVITIFTMGEDKLLMLSKIDFEKFLEKDTLQSTLGLPEEKALLKSCLIEISDDKLSDTLLLADSNGSIAKYWWDEFLKSTLTFTDKENTKKAFSTIEQAISNVKNVSSVDHRDLRNNLVSYFKTSKDYNHEQMIERVLGDFEPESEEVDVNKLKEKLNKIPSKAKFDGNFGIDSKEVRARAKKVYDLGNDIELITRSGTGNIYSIDRGGDNYVAVRTKMNTDSFKKIEL